MRRIRRFAVLALALPLLSGCTGQSADAGVESAEASPPALTDPQVAHVAVTANAIDVEMARLADGRSSHPEVLAFAQTMITDHTAVNERAGALAARLGVRPEDNPVSRSLREDADRTRTTLSALTGDAFDRAYVEREVAYHQAVLDALDQTLIPAASHEELRGLLREVRPAIAAHLSHARALHASLGSGR